MFDNTNLYRVFCRYYAAFFDGKGNPQEVEISEDVFHAFGEFKKEAKKQQNFDERHREYFDLSEEEIASRPAPTQRNIEEVICEKEVSKEVKEAVDSLADVQRRRLLLYFRYDLTYEQIADIENCSHPAIIKSVNAAIKKLKSFF